MSQRRRFGSIRRLPSGRYQARYLGPSGETIPADNTFAAKADADHWLSLVEADLARGTWVDPRAGQVTLETYAAEWLDARPKPLRRRTRELYEGQLDHHILPVLGGYQLRHLTTNVIRRWHADLLSGGKLGEVTVAKCYRLVRAILNTAVEDEIIAKNPCVLKDAGVEHSPERPVATLGQVKALVDAAEPSFRALLLLATFTGLRQGELLGLARRHVDPLHGEIRVERQLQEFANGERGFGPPKSEAGQRIVTIPAAILPDIKGHLDAWAAPGADGLVFCRDDGEPLRRTTVYRKWRKAAKAVGLAGMHLHDLRGTGNTLAAATGASTKELMARLGHSSPRAALIYQHATRDRDSTIAQALSDLIDGATGKEESGEPEANVVPLIREGEATGT
jgi:integrase